MKNLIVYYSLTGNTKFVAKKIALNTDSKLLELKYDDDSFNYNKTLQYIIGSFQALFHYKPRLKDFDIQNNKYDTLFIGTPVWAYGMAPTVRSFLHSKNIKVNKYVLFSTFKGNKGQAFLQMKKYLPEEKIISRKGFKKVLENKEKTEKNIKKWLSDL